jgi:hypothetical protein
LKRTKVSDDQEMSNCFLKDGMGPMLWRVLAIFSQCYAKNVAIFAILCEK